METLAEFLKLVNATIVQTGPGTQVSGNPKHYSPKRRCKPSIARPEQSQQYVVGRNGHLPSSVVNGAGEALLAAGRIRRY
jgi:hypothetical protein